MIIRLKLALDQEEYSALIKSASEELRGVESEARFIIRQELQRRGFLGQTALAPDTLYSQPKEGANE